MEQTISGNDFGTLGRDEVTKQARIYKYLSGLTKSGMPLIFSDQGYTNLARRFGTTVLEFKIGVHEFQKEGGSNASA
jgi:hypothetical protein